MSGCGNCGGNCGSCNGCCGGQMELAEGEIRMLLMLGQIPFLPVARKADTMTPIYLEDTDCSKEEYSLILQALEAKGLIDLDYSKPLGGFDMTAYKGYPVHGTVALTQRGQLVVDMLDKQGIAE